MYCGEKAPAEWENSESEVEGDENVDIMGLTLGKRLVTLRRDGVLPFSESEKSEPW